MRAIFAVRAARMNALPTNVSSRVLAQHVDASGTCVRSPNADAWFPENGRPAGARKLCKGCPVIAECLELALREEAAWDARVSRASAAVALPPSGTGSTGSAPTSPPPARALTARTTSPRTTRRSRHEHLPDQDDADGVLRRSPEPGIQGSRGL
ncbi:WhiB family transcriptional regulator [Streptosporangium lutulentum]